MTIEPTIVGNKLTWKWTAAGLSYSATLTGVVDVTPGPVDPPPPPVPTPTGEGIWLSRKEIEALPDSGAAWEAVKSAASKPPGTPDLSNQDSAVNVNVLAQGLVYARTGLDIHREAVLAVIRSIISTTKLGRTLALGRELAAYVVAADLVDLDAPMRSAFESKLREIMSKTLEDNRTLAQCHEQRPNNWGTHAGASRAAVAAYLGDKAELDRCAAVFKGYLGDRASYAGFKFGGLEFQPDPANPVAVCLPGATKDGKSLDGALPEELRRAGGYNNYVWGALSGAVAQGMFLHRQGYPAFEWMQKAILRAVKWPQDLGHQATGDDAWLIPVVNKVYGTDYTVTNMGPGKNMGWTQWTHQ